VPLARLSEDVGGGVPEHLTSLVVVVWRVKVEESEVARAFERSFQIPKLAVDLVRRDPSQLGSREKRRRETSRLTFAMMTFSAKLFAIWLATSIGEVSHDVPLRTLPSGRVISIS
jgi:hypothetical protein